MKIGSLEVGVGQPCAVIGEVSNAHNGSLDRAFQILDAIKAAGASAAKVQAYTPDELVAVRGDGPAPAPWQDRSMRDLYTQAQTPLDWLPALWSHAAQIALPIFASVFGAESVAACEAVGCPVYKIAHLDSASDLLAAWVLETGKPVLVSCSDRRGIAQAYYAGNGLKHTQLIYCPLGYPPEHVRLQALSRSPFLGFSCHSKEWFLAPMAVALGAKYLEVHVHLRSAPSALEAAVSYDERELALLVKHVCQAESLL